MGRYQGGELWVEDATSRNKSSEPKLAAVGKEVGVCCQVLPDGQEVWGSLKDIRQQVVSFSPKLWHGPQTWTGDRLTVGTFVTRGYDQLSEQDSGFLQRLGFHVSPKESACTSEDLRLGPRHPVVSPEILQRQLYKLHAATGHGSISSLIQLLKKRNVSPAVLEAAEKFQCSVCHEKQKVQPRHLASLEPLPPRFHIISTDIGHWNHPESGEAIQFMLVIDEGSRFRVAKVLSKGSKQQPNAATCLQYLREGWSQYFGMPRTLRLDPGGAFRSQKIVEFCDQESIYLDNTPADARWQISCKGRERGNDQDVSKPTRNLPGSCSRHCSVNL